MRILIDICHPAHAHFFANPIGILKARGHDVFVTSRIKEMATTLLDRMRIEHCTLSAQRERRLGLAGEFIQRSLRMLHVTREYKPEVMAAIGGIFVAHAGLLTRIPSLVFYDTENARLQNALTYPVAHRVYVPACYTGRTPRHNIRRYDGYHELSYLHPKYFTPNRDIAINNGLAAQGDTFLIRLVSWKANHDLGVRGWSADFVKHVVTTLQKRGRVLISSEGPLPLELLPLRYAGDPRLIHHVMAFCRGYLGESATMASECAVLGVPAIYVARESRGYLEEQQSRFGLVRVIPRLDATAIDEALRWVLSRPVSSWQKNREQLLNATIDVAEFVADAIEHRGDIPDVAPSLSHG